MAPTTGLVESFLAAIQASMSVLLVIFYGGLAAHLKLLTPANTKAISKVCVRMFLPALLVTKIGSELHSGSAGRYLTILIWAIICHVVSFLVGVVAHLGLGMPDWTTVALMFNNTTSYPLLLIGALEQTGILRSLIIAHGGGSGGESESTKDAVERAKSYFLVFATISSCLTFAVGPRLIDTEHAAEEEEDGDEGKVDENDDDGREQERAAGRGGDEEEGEEEEGDDNERTGLLNRRASTVSFAPNTFFPSTRRATLASILPWEGQGPLPELKRRPSMVPKEHWTRLGPRTKWWLLFISDFFNAPLLGAIVGAVIGLVPQLHRAFFNDTYQGGIFTAWLTSSWQSIGGLFVPLPVVVAGVSLYTAMRDARRAGADTTDTSNASNGGGGRLADADAKSTSKLRYWLTVTFIMVVRFVVWPAVSISVVYALATRTDILGSDPMLWFAMMLMPTGMLLVFLAVLFDYWDRDRDWNWDC
jgi:predicted permease